MSNIKEIQKPIESHIIEFERIFSASLHSDEGAINEITDYILKMGGKKMRPIFLLLCAGLHGEITHKSYISATLIELTHTASLIHDDVVDEAYFRRGKRSVNALWRSKKAVLIGDFILSRGIHLATHHNHYDTIGIISRVMEDMSKGEILQSDASRDLNRSEEQYFNIIRCKTGALLSACAEAGAISAGATSEQIKNISEFGSLLGLAFQIKDDILDYTAASIIGKPTGNDIREKKMTLPLLSALRNSTDQEQKELMRLLKYTDRNEANVNKVHDFVVSHGGITAAANKMAEIKDSALKILENYPESQYKTALIEFAKYVLKRNQ